MSHVEGQQDADLHWPNGEHRTLSPSNSGMALERWERRIRRHMEGHQTQPKLDDRAR